MADVGLILATCEGADGDCLRFDVDSLLVDMNALAAGLNATGSDVVKPSAVARGVVRALASESRTLMRERDNSTSEPRLPSDRLDTCDD